MSDIWLNPNHDRLKGYTANVKNGKSIVTIQIECDEPGSLGYLLKQLGEIDREQKAAAKPQPAPKKKPLALPAPVKQLAFYDRGDE